MRGFGFLLIGGGIIYLFVAFNMDVSVSSPSTYVPGYGSLGGGEVANLDLVTRRQNHLIVAALITLIGVLLAVFGDRPSVNASVQATKTQPDNPKFDGERLLDSDAYRLWLASKYNVERNEIFDKFVVGESLFGDLNGALEHAHGLEVRELAEIAEQAEQKRKNEEAEAEAERIAQEKIEAEWKRNQPKVIALLVIVVAVIAGILFAGRETAEERSARIAREQAAHAELVRKIEGQFGVDLPDDAKSLIVTENAANSDYLCDDRKDGTLVQFETSLTPKAVKDQFQKTLGNGTAMYEALDDKFDWTWDAGRYHYELNMFGDAQPNAVHLCMTTNDRI
jgi:hypothetical protein